MKLTKTWETFLRIEPLSSVSDEAPPLDESWLVQRGVDPASPAVIRHLRDDVVPLVLSLGEEWGLVWYSFLVHAYPLVPTTEGDRSPYIHLRLGFDSCVDDEIAIALIAERWPEFKMTRRWEVSKEIAGVDAAHLDIGNAWSMIGDQSKWLVDLICQHHTGDLAALVKHTRQFLHFFANATQMRVA